MRAGRGATAGLARLVTDKRARPLPPSLPCMCAQRARRGLGEVPRPVWPTPSQTEGSAPSPPLFALYVRSAGQTRAGRGVSAGLARPITDRQVN